MHRVAWFNGELQEASSVVIRAVSSASLFGKGFFTTMAVYDARPFLWRKHWRRIEQSAGALGLDASSFAKSVVQKALDDVLTANAMRDGRARITFFDESANALWPYRSDRGASLLITTGNAHAAPKKLSLTVSPYRTNSTSPIAGVKSCNYLEKILTKDEARTRGFDEAIQINERGEVTSACMANVFWTKDGVLFTPSLTTSCLPGTTREFVIENLECEEVASTIDELHSADEIFLTSAGLGVAQVAEFEGRQLDRGPHQIMSLIPRPSP